MLIRVIDGRWEVLMVKLIELQNLSEKYGTQFYVYDSNKLVAQYVKLKEIMKSHLEDFQISYAFKANYMPALCSTLRDLGAGAEVCNAVEYTIAKTVGFKYSKIIYNGPLKDRGDVEELLIFGAIVNVDSKRELDEVIIPILRKFPSKSISVGLRCNLDTMKGKMSRFGIVISDDFVEYLKDITIKYPNLKIKSLHCHVKGRQLQDWNEKIIAIVDIYWLIKSKCSISVESINFGGGFPIENWTLSDSIVASIRKTIEKLGNQYPKVIIEPGAELSANSMRLAAKIQDVKMIRERKIACVNISRYQLSPMHWERDLNYKILTQSNMVSFESFDIVGNTCLENDYIVKNHKGHLEVGDYIIVEDVGSYALTLKPAFGTLNIPVLDCSDSKNVSIVKRQECIDDIIKTYY